MKPICVYLYGLIIITSTLHTSWASDRRWVVHSGLHCNRVAHPENRHFSGLGLDLGAAYGKDHPWGGWNFGIFTAIGPFTDVCQGPLEHAVGAQRTLIVAQGIGGRLSYHYLWKTWHLSESNWALSPTAALESRGHQQVWHQSIPEQGTDARNPHTPFERRYLIGSQLTSLNLGMKVLSFPKAETLPQKSKAVRTTHRGLGVVAKIPLVARQSYRTPSGTQHSNLQGYSIELFYEKCITHNQDTSPQDEIEEASHD
ncbi:MAG: hypothetical protein OXT67_06365 [Zetaproteobacteria bacterium]|nr:hypothetical protein [Zetaproteobacteria bacterium]